MKITKPRNLGLLHSTYTLDGNHQWVVKPIIFFDLTNENKVLPEIESWRRVMNDLPAQQVFDEAQAKKSPEVLIAGNVYSPDGSTSTQLQAGFRIGSLAKSLVASGNRIWRKKWLSYKPSRPAPFTSIPISWERAFGGKGNPENPMGQGALTEGNAGETLVALPNFEYSDSRINKPKKQIAPAGFGPISPTSVPRTCSDALFDQDYVDKEFPGLPKGTDFSRFNMAPEDQRLEKLEGTEGFTLFNLHPEIPLLQGKLPKFCPRAFFAINGDFNEIPLKPETVWFFPSSNLGALIFCGQQPVDERYAQLSIDNLLLAYEGIFDEPRSTEYYQEVLLLRTNPDTAVQHVMDESQLSPILNKDEIAQREKEHAQAVLKIETERQAIWEDQKKDLASQNEIEIPEEYTPEPVDARTVVAPEAIKRQDFSFVPILNFAQEKTDEAKRELDKSRPKLDELNSDHSLSDEEIQNLSVARALDRDYAGTRLEKSRNEDDRDAHEAEMLNQLELLGLGLSVQPQKISFLKAQHSGHLLRNIVLTLLEQKESLSYRDFTGVDLSGLNMSGINLEGCIFECANLDDCNFEGANLNSASFVGASLDNTNFTSAQLARSNFSCARGESSTFKNADLTGGTMMIRSHLVGADFTGADFTDLKALESKFFMSAFVGASLNTVTSIKNDFSGSDWTGVKIGQSQFLESIFERSCWVKASAHRVAFINCHFQMAQVRDGEFERCQFAGESWLTAAEFDSSTFVNSGFRNAKGTGASFKEAQINDSDLGMVSFTGGQFQESKIANSLANGGNFSLANFTDASIVNSKFGDSSFNGAALSNTNFLSTDVLLADFSNANPKDAKNIMPLKTKRLANAS